MKDCLASTNYTLRADIYRPIITQDNIGAAITKWRYERTISCYVRSILRKGVGENSTYMSIDDLINVFNSMLKLRCTKVIPSDRIIVNIRNENQTIYQENQDPASEGGYNVSTIYDSYGSVPILDYDGSIIEYETILKRREIQKIETG